MKSCVMLALLQPHPLSHCRLHKDGNVFERCGSHLRLQVVLGGVGAGEERPAHDARAAAATAFGRIAYKIIVLATPVAPDT